MSLSNFTPTIWSKSFLNAVQAAQRSLTPAIFVTLAQEVGCHHQIDCQPDVTLYVLDLFHDHNVMWRLSGEARVKPKLWTLAKDEYQRWITMVCPDSHPGDIELAWWTWHEQYGVWEPDMTPYVAANDLTSCGQEEMQVN